LLDEEELPRSEEFRQEANIEQVSNAANTENDDFARMLGDNNNTGSS
jgi:hypothetical protein